MTIVTNSSFYSFASEILARQYAVTSKKTKTFAQIVVDSIQLTDPEKADNLKKKLDDASQAIAQLRSGKSNAAQSSKAAAAQKIQRIKEEIQMLMRMGGDPKMIAKQIRKLAQDLAAAAREYASTSGSLSPDSLAVTDTTAGASGADCAPSNATQSDNLAGSGATSAIGLTVPVSSESDAAEKKEEKDDNAMPYAAITSQDKGVQQSREALRQEINTAVQKNGAEIAARTSTSNADREFAEEVRTLVALLKILARQQKQRLQQSGDHLADQEIAQTSQALADVEKALPV